MTNNNHKIKKTARDRKEARQARRIINGIFFGLIVLVVLILIAYAILLA